MTSDIKCTIENGIQHIQIARLEKKNALTGAMYAAMASALMEGDQDETIAVNLLYGEPGCFTAGNDLKDFLAFAQTGNLDDSVFDFLKVLALLEKPLIIAVEGPAIGIGTTMLFHADLVYASPSAVFKTPFLDLGLVPEAASSYLMPLTMGHQKSYEILALGQTLSADEARAAGFVNAVLPEAELMPHARSVAEALAKKPGEALRITKDLMRAPLKEAIKQTMEKEVKAFSARLQSDEAKQAFLAFLNPSKS